MGFLDEVLEQVKPEEKSGDAGAEGEGTSGSGQPKATEKKRMHTYSPEFEKQFGTRKD